MYPNEIISEERMMVKNICIFLSGFVLFITGFSSDKQELTLPFSAIAKNLEWRGVAVAEEDYSIWGSSPIMDENGRVHLFVARWPEMNVTPGWRKSSEIAHYVADHPQGPFRFVNIVIKGSGLERWDKYGPHNPEIKRAGEYYALVFIANNDYHQPPHPANQRIGMLISKSLNGPWKRLGQNGMIIEKSNDPDHWTFTSTNGVANPTFFEYSNQYGIYFKTRTADLKTRYGLAIAKNLEGPFIIQEKPVTDADFFFEDPNTFIWGHKLYMIADDNFGEYTGIKGGGILWSIDDIHELNTNTIEVGFDRIPAYYKNYDEGKVTKIYGGDPKFERPKVLTIDGEPAYLYATSGWNVFGGRRTVSHVLKINLNPEENTAVIPVPSREDRASAAGWLGGGTWMDQHADINRLARSRKIDLVFLGNSITQSWGGEGRNVVSVGGKTWKKYYQKRNAADFGISGDRTQHLLWRIDNGNFDSILPRVIVLLIGTNNLNDNTAEEIVEGIERVVLRLRKKLPESKIVLMGVLPRGEKANDPYRKKIGTINAAIKENDDRENVFYIDIGEAFLLPDGSANKELMADDCLHLRPAGYATWAREIEPLLQQLLEE
jgi:lysophospholipase L1-like esterase